MRKNESLVLPFHKLKISFGFPNDSKKCLPGKPVLSFICTATVEPAVLGVSIYATSIDYDVTAQATKRFFAMVQDKLHWAIHGQTAAEVVYNRADAEKEYMGLTSWKDGPVGKIQRFDVVVAKNYLTENEVVQLERLVSAYLDVAESMALRKIPMTMQDWEIRLNRFVEATDREVLKDAGKVTAEIAKAHAESEFEKYRVIQDRLYQSDFDKFNFDETIEGQPEICKYCKSDPCVCESGRSSDLRPHG